jgi:hypothetical protein
MGDAVCCICLDPGKEDDPLFLLSCGCKAFFHKACETRWTDTLPINTPVVCLICKREPIMKVNYCYLYDIGLPQKFLWNTLFLFAIELPIGLYYNTWVIGAQGLYILLYPFVAPFPYDLLYFLLQYNITIFVHIILICIFSDKLKLTTITFYRYLHIAILSFYINNRNKVNPLRPFIISREITHSKTVWLQQ